MDWQQYEKDSERTEKKFPEGKVLDSMQMELLHSAIGISTESGEILDAFKKHLIYGADLDIINLTEELGDIMWYVAIMTRYLKNLTGATLEDDILELNIDKLKARYPDKFTEKDALNRDLDKEREILAGDTTSPDGC